MSSRGDDERRTREDAAWREIVDNYGARPEVDEAPAPAPTHFVVPAPEPEPEPEAVVVRPEAEERYVPPPPPPLPRPAPPRAVAWAGVFGAPLVLLVCFVGQIYVPTLIDYLLLGWFVGGFLYLVATMSREPREPWDDGSRI
ncbi:hypothetical protein [Nocardioides sp. P5_C9_2]